MIIYKAFRIFVLLPTKPQVYPTGPGVHVSWPHTLSVTSGIEHPVSVQNTSLHRRASLFNCIGTGILLLRKEDTKTSRPE